MTPVRPTRETHASTERVHPSVIVIIFNPTDLRTVFVARWAVSDAAVAAKFVAENLAAFEHRYIGSVFCLELQFGQLWRSNIFILRI